MATAIIKKQILKVLSRFTKNVDADQIKFSSFSQANLSDLALNEVVLTEVLEFPVWMRISRAVCNRVSIQIPWTHLSSQPIRIGLDEVYVDIETCSEFRPPAESHVTNPTGYGRTEMAVDGMYISVNTLEINFRAPSFHLSFQVNRVKVFSTSPDYNGTTDLRMTRLKDESRDAILVFKCVTWQTLRVEASSGPESQGLTSSSIRLITNAGQTRIALKKTISGCVLIASRLQILMDDLLWVLTPSQLKAAFLVADELKTLASKAETLGRSKKAASKLDDSQRSRNRAKKAQVGVNTAASRISQYFDKIDIMETSYHFHLAKLNLHICDEPQNPDLPRRKYHDAAILIELSMVMVDYYPFHIPSATRQHWLLYQEPHPLYLPWQNDFLASYVARTVPPHMMSTFCNPAQVTLDSDTLDWLTLVCADLLIQSPNRDTTAMEIPEVICRFEALFPKMVLPSSSSVVDKPFFKGMQFQSGKIVISNCQIGRSRTLADAVALIDRENTLLRESESFPNSVPDPDLTTLLDYAESLIQLKTLPLSVWYCAVDPVWIEFIDLRNPKLRPLPFLDAFPLSLWLIPLLDNSRTAKTTTLVVFALVDLPLSVIKAQCTAAGFNIIMHCQETALKVTESIGKLVPDKSKASKEAGSVVFCSFAALPKVELTLLLEEDTMRSSSSEVLSVISQAVKSEAVSLTLPAPAAIPLVGNSFDVPSFNEAIYPEEDPHVQESESDTRSLQSAMSEISITDMTGFTLDDDMLCMSVPTEKDQASGLTETADMRSKSHSASPSFEKNTAMALPLSIEISRSAMIFSSWTDLAVMKLVATDLSFKEGDQMNLQDAYEKFYSRNSTDIVDPVCNGTQVVPTMSLRFEIKQLAGGSSEALSKILCEDLLVDCSSEIMSRMGPFFATDVIGEPLPLHLRLRRFRMVLRDARANGSTTAPPFALSVPAISCQRGADGIFVVRPYDISGHDREEQGIIPVFGETLEERIGYLEKQRESIDVALKILQETAQARKQM